jgi:hypothetical protein
MILTFCDDKFEDLILQGKKLYTLRKSDRYKPGQILQLWRNNPRNVTKNPYQFATAVCTAVDEMELIPEENKVIHISSTQRGCNEKYELKDLNFFAQCDGFDSWSEMKEFFPERYVRYRIWFENVKPVKR